MRKRSINLLPEKLSINREINMITIIRGATTIDNTIVKAE